MSRIPKPYEIYKHFKGNLYQILSIAEHSETGEKLVIYQALYGEYKIYARPMEGFTEVLEPVSETDRKEAAAAEQKASVAAKAATMAAGCEEEQEINIDPMVLKFLDAGTYEERLQILTGLQSRITDDMITTMAVSCDIEVPDGSLEERFQGLKNCLLTLDRFECNRLR